MKNRHPIRMCIACRSRYPQKTLIRLKQVDQEIIAYDGTGRSFYLCRNCLLDPKKIVGLSKRFKQDKERFSLFLSALASETDPCD
ncbi:MAG: DUF448 domain-containing protein [Sulfurovum sp.]|nr:MAG: DUF448 domain-containing protein [Sulfurovum sp.]